MRDTKKELERLKEGEPWRQREREKEREMGMG